MKPNAAVTTRHSKRSIMMIGENNVAPKNRFISVDLNRVVT